MLQLNDIAIGYGSKVIASHLSAHLQKGRLTCLIGRNGTGKSTLMRTIAAFQPALTGAVVINSPSCPVATRPSNLVASGPFSPIATSPSSLVASGSATGVPLSTLSPRDRARLIGIVLTERPDLQNMTVHEMASMGRSPYTGFWGSLSKDDDAIVRHSLDLVGMTSFHDRRMSTLSDGETQKVMIAKALAQQTPLILLDEPTAFLDYPSKVETLTMLRRLCHEEDKTVLLSTHDLDVAMRLTDDVWFMKDGNLLTGTPQSLSEPIKEFMNF